MAEWLRFQQYQRWRKRVPFAALLAVCAWLREVELVAASSQPHTGEGSPSVLFLSSQMYGIPGGVQTFMRRIREVLAEYAQERKITVDCVSLNDAVAGEHPRSVAATSFHGCGASKPVFVATALRLALRRRYDWVLVGHLGQSPAGYWLKRMGLVRRYAVVLHGREAWERVSDRQRQAAAAAQVVIATTQYTSRVFAEHNEIPSERFRVLPLSIDTNGVVPVFEPVSNGEFMLLSVARLSAADADKGVEIAIRAMAKIKATISGARLVVAGDGSERSRLQGVVDALGLRDAVSLCGHCSDEQLRDLYRDCDVFVLPSRQEGFGIVFLEAMAHGKPCIGGNHGGIPEVITHGETGYLVEFGDIEALAAYAIRLGTDRQLRQRMGAAARQAIAGRNTFLEFSKRLKSILDEPL